MKRTTSLFCFNCCLVVRAYCSLVLSLITSIRQLTLNKDSSQHFLPASPLRPERSCNVLATLSNDSPPPLNVLPFIFYRGLKITTSIVAQKASKRRSHLSRRKSKLYRRITYRDYRPFIKVFCHNKTSKSTVSFANRIPASISIYRSILRTHVDTAKHRIRYLDNLRHLDCHVATPIFTSIIITYWFLSSNNLYSWLADGAPRFLKQAPDSTISARKIATDFSNK